MQFLENISSNDKKFFSILKVFDLKLLNFIAFFICGIGIQLALFSEHEKL